MRVRTHSLGPQTPDRTGRRCRVKRSLRVPTTPGSAPGRRWGRRRLEPLLWSTASPCSDEIDGRSPRRPRPDRSCPAPPERPPVPLGHRREGSVRTRTLECLRCRTGQAGVVDVRPPPDRHCGRTLPARVNSSEYLSRPQILLSNRPPLSSRPYHEGRVAEERETFVLVGV